MWYLHIYLFGVGGGELSTYPSTWTGRSCDIYKSIYWECGVTNYVLIYPNWWMAWYLPIYLFGVDGGMPSSHPSIWSWQWLTIDLSIYPDWEVVWYLPTHLFGVWGDVLSTFASVPLEWMGWGSVLPLLHGSIWCGNGVLSARLSNCGDRWCAIYLSIPIDGWCAIYPPIWLEW